MVTAVATSTALLDATPAEVAKLAGLRYVSDTAPGIRRAHEGEGFRYFDPNGDEITAERELERIQALAIPPAWTDVWICPDRRGHIQATGRDERGRKQYLYHPHWREVRDETKYHRMVLFGETLPAIRERVSRDLGQRNLTHDRVVATVVRLMDETAIRVGNEEYARDNHSYGLTTLRDQHVDVSGSTIEFHFMGKSGKEHRVGVQDRRVARAIKRLQDLPGQLVFQYVGHDGTPHPVDSADVNDYLRQIAEQHFTAKDFRTWHGTVIAARTLYDLGPAESKTALKRNVTTAVKAAAAHLGNTPAVCRKSYIHPAVIEAYESGALFELWPQVMARKSTHQHAWLEPDEVATLAVLEHLERQEA